MRICFDAMTRGAKEIICLLSKIGNPLYDNSMVTEELLRKSYKSRPRAGVVVQGIISLLFVALAGVFLLLYISKPDLFAFLTTVETSFPEPGFTLYQTINYYYLHSPLPSPGKSSSSFRTRSSPSSFMGSLASSPSPLSSRSSIPPSPASPIARSTASAATASWTLGTATSRIL